MKIGKAILNETRANRRQTCFHNAAELAPEVIGLFDISKSINRADENCCGTEGCWDSEVAAVGRF